ncbi:MAG: hypothetical protein H7A16_04200 [Sinobacteraceae bacterium]|nr:hypothetical protein [Nevskiaceae bacterium]
MAARNVIRPDLPEQQIGRTSFVTESGRHRSRKNSCGTAVTKLSPITGKPSQGRDHARAHRNRLLFFDNGHDACGWTGLEFRC